MSKTAEATAAKRVALGEALLDEKLPGWRPKIERGSIWMKSFRSCILGQAKDAGSHPHPEALFDETLDELGDDGHGCEFAAAHGFGIYGYEDLVTFDMLREAWRDALEPTGAQ